MLLLLLRICLELCYDVKLKLTVAMYQLCNITSAAAVYTSLLSVRRHVQHGLIYSLLQSHPIHSIALLGHHLSKSDLTDAICESLVALASNPAQLHAALQASVTDITDAEPEQRAQKAS